MPDQNNKLINKAHQEGEPVGILFAQTVTSVQKGLQGNTGVGAVDIAVHFKSVDIENKSKKFVVFSKNKQSESSIEIKLATRIYPATGESDPDSQSSIIQPSGKPQANHNPPKPPPKKVEGIGD